MKLSCKWTIIIYIPFIKISSGMNRVLLVRFSLLSFSSIQKRKIPYSDQTRPGLGQLSLLAFPLHQAQILVAGKFGLCWDGLHWVTKSSTSKCQSFSKEKINFLKEICRIKGPHNDREYGSTPQKWISSKIALKIRAKSRR